jgi:hypothetical protein
VVPKWVSGCVILVCVNLVSVVKSNEIKKLKCVLCVMS